MNQSIDQSILRNSFLFKDISDAILADIVKHCERLELPAGETLFAQDTDPDTMYYLEDGQVHIVREYPDGYSVILATEIPGYVIGELSLLAQQARTGSVVGVCDCDLIALRRDAIFEVFKQHPGAALPALQHVSERLYRLNLLVRESAVGNVGARVASVLLLMAENTASQNGTALNVPRLARATALDADTVEHLLNEWASANILSFSGQQVTVKQIAALREKAG